MPLPPWLDEALTDLRKATALTLPSPQITPVHGGDINTTYQLCSGETRLFIKSHSAPMAEAMFAAESEGLTALSQCRAFKIPNVVYQGTAHGVHYLVLEHLDMIGTGNWHAMGTALATLHRISSNQFGWQAPNFIGTSPQINAPCRDWAKYWWQNRLVPQLDYCHKNGLIRLSQLTDRLQSTNDRLLTDHRPEPSLLHGDLWSGNAAFTTDGTPCLYDPACYYGDREADLALTELFGGFPTEFYQSYTSEWPLDEGYAARKEWYNLYHLLNHANLFGGHYVSASLEAIERCESLCQ